MTKTILKQSQLSTQTGYFSGEHRASATCNARSSFTKSYIHTAEHSSALSLQVLQHLIRLKGRSSGVPWVLWLLGRHRALWFSQFLAILKPDDDNKLLWPIRNHLRRTQRLMSQCKALAVAREKTTPSDVLSEILLKVVPFVPNLEEIYFKGLHEHLRIYERKLCGSSCIQN